MLDDIKNALEANFDIPVYYGTSAEATGTVVYDYIVFWREQINWHVTSKGDYTEYYKVALVRQNFIPEDEETKVIDVLRKIPGLKEDGNISYSYLTKPSTALAMEVAEYSFIAARKR